MNRKLLIFGIGFLFLLVMSVGAYIGVKANDKPPAVQYTSAKAMFDSMESFYNNTDYRKAQELFNELKQKYPNSPETARAIKLMVNIDELVKNEANIKQEIDGKTNRQQNLSKELSASSRTSNRQPSNSTATTGGGTRIEGDSFVATSEETLDTLNRLSANKDEAGVKRMIARNEVYVVRGGTKVSVLNRGYLVHRIEIAEGPMAGKRGFVPVEFVKN